MIQWNIEKQVTVFNLFLSCPYTSFALPGDLVPVLFFYFSAPPGLLICLLILLSCARSLLVRLDYRLSERSEREISKLSNSYLSLEMSLFSFTNPIIVSLVPGVFEFVISLVSLHS